MAAVTAFGAVVLAERATARSRVQSEQGPQLESGRRERDDDDASSGGDCFVATAACGGPDDAAVIELRRFHDEQLSRTTAGRRFIAWYYRRGPALAAVIRGHDVRRAVVRVLWCTRPPGWRREDVTRSVECARAARAGRSWRRCLRDVLRRGQSLPEGRPAQRDHALYRSHCRNQIGRDQRPSRLARGTGRGPRGAPRTR